MGCLTAPWMLLMHRTVWEPLTHPLDPITASLEPVSSTWVKQIEGKRHCLCPLGSGHEAAIPAHSQPPAPSGDGWRDWGTDQQVGTADGQRSHALSFYSVQSHSCWKIEGICNVLMIVMLLLVCLCPRPTWESEDEEDKERKGRAAHCSTSTPRCTSSPNLWWSCPTKVSWAMCWALTGIWTSLTSWRISWRWRSQKLLSCRMAGPWWVGSRASPLCRYSHPLPAASPNPRLYWRASRRCWRAGACVCVCVCVCVCTHAYECVSVYTSVSLCVCIRKSWIAIEYSSILMI